MRVLLASRCPPLPLHYGDRLILHHLLRELRDLGHAIDLIALEASPATPGLQDRLQDCADTVELIRDRPRRPHQYLARLARPFPERASACWHPDLWRAVERRLASGHYDLVHLFGGIQVYELRNLVRGFPNLIAPYESHTLFLTREVARARSPVASFRARAALAVTRRYERLMFVGFDRVVVLTDRDRDMLVGLAPGLQVEVIPNGVRVAGTVVSPRSPSTVVFSGNFAYEPNVQAALSLVGDIWPALRAAAPGVRLRLIGANPPSILRALAASDIEVTGWVPDMAAAIAGATCFVAPLRHGAGMKNKILEAMAAGVPVVTTPTGGDGLAVIDGTHLVCRETASELASAALSLIREPARAVALATAAREYVRAHHDWAAIGARYDALYRAIVRERA